MDLPQNVQLSDQNRPSNLRLQQSQNNSRIIKQINIRKMSTMPEEEGTEETEETEEHLHDSADSDNNSQSDQEHERETNKLLDNNKIKTKKPPPQIQINNNNNNNNSDKLKNLSSESIINDGKNHLINGSSSKINSNFNNNNNQREEKENYLIDCNKHYRDNSVHGGKLNRGIELYGGRHKYPSMRSLKSNINERNFDEHGNNYHHHQQLLQQQHVNYYNNNQQPATSWASIVCSDVGSQCNSIKTTTPFYDSVSIRSLASIGMGSSDGRKLTIRRVPTSPSELLNIVHPPTPIEDDISTLDSFDDGHGDDSTDYRIPKRPHWENKMQFVLACVGYSVGLGNVWRFPYLCYKSGGGVFLVPYFIILIVCGIPLLYMELALGQFTRRGPIGALGQICPLLKGAGLSSVVISFLMSTYHNVIIAYAIYYFFAAFRADHPWAGCNNSWNTPACWAGSSNDNKTRPDSSRTPSEEFFDKKVLQISSGIEEPGNLRWEIFACLFSAWIIVYFSTWKSIKSSSQVRYLTATLPLFLIIVFLARSLTLEGAEKGLQFFFRPRWNLLADHKVWVNAAAQIFSSVGISFGSMICFASYNKFHNNIFIDTMAVSFINAFSCLLVGIFAFATIGNIAMEQNTSVEAVLSDGPGLVFVVYPQAMAKMPASQLWAVLFFFMLLCLSLNSQFAIIEVVVTSIQDGFPNWVKANLLCHEVLVFIICIVSFIFGLPNITQGGIYFFQLIDHYAASISIMFLAFFEVIAISWFYGVKRLGKNVKEMTGRVPSLYFRYCWLVAAPLLIMSVWVFILIDYEPPTYGNGAYKYPWWAEAIGWGIASLSLMCIPAFAIYVLIKSDGATFIERLRNSIKPHFEACIACGQEYCAEQHSIHSLEDHELKQPLQEMNSLMNTIPVKS